MRECCSKLKPFHAYISHDKANFVYFRYHGNKVPSGLNFNDTIKLPDLEPLFGARLSAVSVTLAKLNQFCVKIPVFRFHGNRGPSRLNFNDTIKLPDLENPLCGGRLLAVSAILAELNQFFVL